MKCGNCDKTDGLCYTSLPPQVKCTITGRFHKYDDECDCSATGVYNGDMKEGKLYTPSGTKVSICTHCIVCDEPIELTSVEEMYLSYGKNINAKVCDKCKQAIMYVRKQLNI